VGASPAFATALPRSPRHCSSWAIRQAPCPRGRAPRHPRCHPRRRGKHVVGGGAVFHHRVGFCAGSVVRGLRLRGRRGNLRPVRGLDRSRVVAAPAEGEAQSLTESYASTSFVGRLAEAQTRTDRGGRQLPSGFDVGASLQPGSDWPMDHPVRDGCFFAEPCLSHRSPCRVAK
jgi:hypothetical protein